MSKLVTFFLIAVAFVYAVWLVAMKRRPDMRQGSVVRRAFVMLTLFFMGWLGAPVHAAENKGPDTDNEAATETTRRMDLPTALRSAWEAMLLLNLPGKVSPGDMEALRQALAGYPEALDAAVAEGVISRGATEVLQFAFTDMREHLNRQLATCYMAMPAIAAPRGKMAASIKYLAMAADRDIEPSALREIRKELMVDIMEIHLLRLFQNEYDRIMAPGKEERRRKMGDLFQAKQEGKIDETAFRDGYAEVAEEARRQLRDGYFRLPGVYKEADLWKAAGILVDIARNLPE